MDRISDENIAKLYASLMAEVKSRLQKLHLEANLLKTLPEPIVQKTFRSESCYLQLRRITELVAVAVLLVHTPYEKFRSQDLAKIFQADKLLKTLAKLSASAVPRPAATVERPPIERVLLTFVMPRPTFDVRDAITDIYKTSCDKLHLGSLHSILRKRNKQYSSQFIWTAFERLTTLLDTHVIVLPDNRIMIAWLDWRTGDNVHCQWLDPSPPQP
jgi:hypothetical protein